MSQVKKPRRGQAEIIGAVIATGVMLLAITAMFYSIIRLQQSTSDAYAKRIAFESERTLEKLTVRHDPSNNKCIINNTGGVDIRVVRVWISDIEFRDPVEIGFPAIIRRGDVITNYKLEDAPVAIVTSRGNVFEVKPECERQAYGRTIIEVIYGNATGFISSQNIIGTYRLTSNQSCIEYTVEGIAKEKDVVLIYKNDTQWIYHRCNPNDPSTYGWKVVLIPSQSKINIAPDLDRSRINEVIVAINKTDKVQGSDVVKLLEVGESKSKPNLTLILSFYNIIRIRNATDAVTIFYKFVIQTSGGGKPHQIAFSPYISLILANQSGVVYSAPGSVSVSSSSQDVVVVTGYVVFPRYFYYFVDGNYNIEITLKIDASAGSTGVKSVRLEYIAITGADILWLPLP